MKNGFNEINGRIISLSTVILFASPLYVILSGVQKICKRNLERIKASEKPNKM